MIDPTFSSPVTFFRDRLHRLPRPHRRQHFLHYYCMLRIGRGRRYCPGRQRNCHTRYHRRRYRHRCRCIKFGIINTCTTAI